MRSSRRIVNRRDLLAGAASSGALALLAASPKGRGLATIERLGSVSPQITSTLNVAWPVDPPNLDPQTQPNAATSSLACAVMNGLLKFQLDADPQVGFQHTLEPDLAAMWETVDFVTWVLHLRPDASFMPIPPVNGHAIEAEDVRASFERASRAARSEHRAVAAMFNASVIETPDPQTVVFHLPSPYAPLSYFLASVPDGLILPREALAGAFDPNTQMIGSGPFYLSSSVPGVAVVLQRNAGYFEQGIPYLDGVRQAIIPTEDEQVAQFTAGNLDLIRVSQQAMMTAVTQNPAAQVIRAIDDANYALFFQLGAPNLPFADIRLRRAVSESLDRMSIAQALYAGSYDLPFAVNLTMGPSALHWNDLDANVQQLYTYDLSDATQLLRASGYEGLAVKLAYPAGTFGPQFDAMAQMIADDLAALNWTVTLTPIDYLQDYLGDGGGYRYGNIPSDTMLLGQIHAFTNVDQYLFDVYHSQSTSNIERLSDPMLDAMIDQARAAPPPQLSQQSYLDAQQYLASKLYSVGGLPIGYRYAMLQTYVQNFAYSPEAAGVGRSWYTLSVGS